ncbi:MAG: methyltransferase [Phenylobacterium zucineum]|nr:MAG: methyltransferase [Phenylobacterium zucineum]
MSRLAFEGLSYTQMMSMADGLLRIGDTRLAGQIYEHAARNATGPAIDLKVRQGLVDGSGTRVTMLLNVLNAVESCRDSAFVSAGLATWDKILPFFMDKRFAELAKEHAHLLPLPNWHWNLQTVVWAVQQARDVPGDFVELGVFRGHTTRFVADYLGFDAWAKTWWLYDTFEGIPKDQLDEGWDNVNQHNYVGTYSYDEVRDRFAGYGNIKVIQGRVPEILAEGAPERIAFMHIDLNNMTAEIAALDALFDRVSPGGIIVFDDYCWVAAARQHLAEKAWFAARGLQILPLPTGQGVFVKSA